MIKAYLFCDLYFIYVVEAFITLNYKSSLKRNEFISYHDISIYVFVFSINLLQYEGFNFIVTHACPLGLY